MKFEFSLKNQALRRIVFALALDKKKMTERIIIGESSEVRLQFERGISEAYYDQTRPLGSLLIDFESDKHGNWNVNAMKMRETYNVIFATNKAKTKELQPYIDFLREKANGGEPSAMFAAIHTWEEYLNCYNLNHGADLFTERTAALYRPFFRDEKLRETDNDILNPIKDIDSQVELWYPAAKRPFECVVGFSSFLPLIAYYLNRIGEWGHVFQKCKVCGKDFLARSRHYELCSDKCRKVQAVEAKREFDERAKGDRLEQLDEAAYYYWYNRLRKLRKGKAANPDKAAAFKVAFDKFREEAKRRKAAVKCGDSALNDFAGWLIRQQDEADRLMDED